jgi:hypothetical protein
MGDRAACLLAVVLFGHLASLLELFQHLALLGPECRDVVTHQPQQRQPSWLAPIMNCSTMSGASRANRSSLPTVVGISPSARAISTTLLKAPESSRECQYCARATASMMRTSWADVPESASQLSLLPLELQGHEGFQRAVHQASTSSSSAPISLGANSPISLSQPNSRHFTLMPCTSPTWTRSIRSIIRLAMRWRSTGNN